LRTEGLTEVVHPAVSAAEKAKLWTIRKAAVPILYKLKGPKKIIPLIEDAAVPTEGLVPYFEGLYALMHRRQVEFVVYGHIAKGLLHTRPLLDMKNPQDVRLLKPLADEVFELVHSLGGAISGEHGDGRIRSAYIKKQYSDIYDLFCEAKQLIDPHNVFNPEIITSDDDHLVEKHLRFGTAYHCRELAQKTLNWKDSFTQEVEKCHGCTQCTTVTTATRMCPVYKFTRDEAAAPKAKANLLRGLISGAIDDKHLYAEAFQNVIEQCVNCGSCFAECPSNVNIPKMAIEAKSHYVRRFGPSFENKILVSAELAGRTSRKFSGAIRRFADLPGVKKLAERITGISARREFPYFPAKSLFERVAAREGSGSPKVLYFAGCYASYLQPAIGQSALKVLKQMGMTVLTPPQHCCGLPMLSKGMVAEAKRKIQQNLQKWQDLVKAVDHVVVTCSSCGFSLGHEWNFLVDDAVLEALQNKLVHISRLINQYFDRLTMRNGHLNLAYHNPCHLKIQQDPSCSLDLLSRMDGIAIEDLKSHCCGMAGTWGFSAGHYDLSKKISADMISKLNASDALVGVTDCPTCRMQMEHFSTKKIKHPVEVVAECIKTG
jgi:Fe-S oxidoreductase